MHRGRRGGAPGRLDSDAMILALTPNESLVVDVARGLDGGAVVEPAHLVQASYRSTVSVITGSKALKC